MGKAKARYRYLIQIYLFKSLINVHVVVLARIVLVLTFRWHMPVSQDPPNQSLPVADVKGGLSLVDAWNETWGRWSGNPSGVKARLLLAYLSIHQCCI